MVARCWCEWMSPHIDPADQRPGHADGHDVTASFQVQSDGTLLGLVTGLRSAATGWSRRHTASSRRRWTSSITPSTGPSSPARDGFVLLSDDGLWPGSRAPCPAELLRADAGLVRLHEHLGAFVPLSDPTATPAGPAMATVNGQERPVPRAGGDRHDRPRHLDGGALRRSLRPRCGPTPAGTASSSTPSAAAVTPASTRATAPAAS